MTKEKKAKKIPIIASLGATPGVIANVIMRDHYFITLRESRKKLYYDDGIYRNGADSIIREGAGKLCGTVLTQHFANEVLFQVEINTYRSLDEFDKDYKIINVRNGLLNLNTGELKEHSPDYLSAVQIPVKYDSKATCPKIQKFFSEVLQPQDIPIAYELFGYCLLRQYNVHRAFLFTGGGENGKSTFINLLQNFLGKDNCSAVSLQMIEEDRFMVAQLHNKLANLHADLPQRDLKETGLFKSLVGEDAVEAQHKNQTPFKFRNYAKLVFSANSPPRISSDDSHAFWRRWIVLEFPNQFTQVNGKRVNGLVEQLSTPEELSGLLNLAIEGLQKLKANGDFSYKKTAIQTADLYKEISNSAWAFCEQCCLFSPEVETEKDTLYCAYEYFCKEKHLPIKDKNWFFRLLNQQYDVLKVNNAGETIYKGIFFKGIQGKIVLPITSEQWEKSSKS